MHYTTIYVHMRADGLANHFAGIQYYNTLLYDMHCTSSTSFFHFEMNNFYTNRNLMFGSFLLLDFVFPVLYKFPYEMTSHCVDMLYYNSLQYDTLYRF